MRKRWDEVRAPIVSLEVLKTERLLLRPFTTEDAEFILRLLNEPSFLQQVGDKGVRNHEQAIGYLLEGPIRSYNLHGHGLMCVERRETGLPLGMCGLLRRKPDQDPDLGYAFLPEYWSKGYAIESAEATLDWGMRVLGFSRILALVAPGNARSIILLQKLGFTEAGFAPSDQAEPSVSMYEWCSGELTPRPSAEL